jgi:hypothetical protein
MQAVAVRKTHPAYAVMIAKAHSDLIRRHRDGYTSSSLYFHLVKHYPTVTRRGVAAALAKMASNGQASHEGVRWKVDSAARRSLGKSKSKAKKPRKASAYVRFAASKRAEVVAANPGASFGDVSKALGAAWKQLSAAEKAAYAAPAVAPAVAAPAAAPAAAAAPAKRAVKAKVTKVSKAT